MKPVSVGIVGLGYWGPNWLRNFAAQEGCTLAWGCDLAVERVTKFSRMYPATRFTKNVEDMFGDKSLDAVVIATPTSTHFPLAKAALLAGKHVLVEKPMTSTSKEGRQLVELAKKKGKMLLVDHTFAYTSAVQRIATMSHEKKFGDLLYFDSTRINLGLIQKDTNVLWDLAIHDLTILAAIKDLSLVTEVNAIGSAHYGKHVEDGHLHLAFKDGFAAHIHCSWLSPVKIRKTLIAGRKAMITYDDTEPSEKIRLYDKGVDHDTTKPDPFFPKYRSGDVLIPALPVTEALATEAKHFLECIRGNAKPIVSGEDGTMMVKILELADESLAKKKPMKTNF
ncbi:MAG: Gfo/Idh/MocA family oxidoreductase [Candidatus Peribacteraceae bacterium]|nr:Gfo/Idh/MocA family oxidoreductase [Candidatus Peribacteraceae bacterium]